MMMQPQIDKALITLEVSGQNTIFILLCNDGTIHRKGNGALNDTTSPLTRGVSDQGHLDALMSTVDQEVFNFSGVIDKQPRAGNECVLSIVLNGTKGEEFIYRVIYGDQSEGPPKELADILLNAVKITDPWYRGSLAQEMKTRKWWQFWN